MADESDLREPADATRVNVSDYWKLLYWRTRLMCTEAQLLAAIERWARRQRIDMYLKRR